MALEHWLQTLRSTETYRSGVYTEAEYSIKRRLPRFIRDLPPVPRADADRHIIVIEVVGDAPVFVAALTVERPLIHVPAQDADRLLFIFVEMRPRPLDLSPAPVTYRLADGNNVDCRLSLEWRVSDAEAFWRSAADPVAALRSRVIETVKQHFGTVTSEDLIEDLAHVERSLSDRIIDRGITIIKNGLETPVYQHTTVPGVRIDAVRADIKPVEEWESGPGLRRRKDRLLELDRTYAPHKVRDVACFLGRQLLENFYYRPWQEAMNELATAFEAKKAEFLKDRLIIIEDSIKRAQAMEVDETYIKQLKDIYGEALCDGLDRTDIHSTISDQTFLLAVLGPPQPTARLGAGAMASADVKTPG